MNETISAFSNPDSVKHYADRPRRIVPGFSGLHRMAEILVAERVADDARLLVVGAGGGLESKAFAESRPGWTFDGVDPSSEMLKLAEQTLGPLGSRVTHHEGYVDIAPIGPFDASVCLLTLHFVAPDERLRTLKEIHRRLKPGAPFVSAHLSLPNSGVSERACWLSRYAAFAAASGVEPDKAEAARSAIDEQLHILSSEQDESLLVEAGFSDISLFYVGFTFRGWVAYA